MTTAADPVVAPAMDRPIQSPLGSIIRDIARGGFTGIIVGLVGAGLGGRIVMRLAALLVPASNGALTENGNRIGDITLGGSVGLALFGLAAGVVAAMIWVVVSPWIPGAGLRRAVLAMPVAVAFGAAGLVEGDNQDFFVLRHDPTVVVLLVALVAVFGLSFALVDAWLDRRLPAATGIAGTAYAVVTAVGVLPLPLVVITFLTDKQPAVVLTGGALVVLGVLTLSTWVRRIDDSPTSARLVLAGRITLATAVVIGFARVVPEVSAALGLT